MLTENMNPDEDTGTTPRDVGDYEHEVSVHGAHVWTHSETGLTVSVKKTAGRRDGYGRVAKGYRAVARNANGDVVDQICGSSFGGYLPNKSDAFRAAYCWMQDRPDGELQGDEEVRY